MGLSEQVPRPRRLFLVSVPESCAARVSLRDFLDRLCFFGPWANCGCWTWSRSRGFPLCHSPECGGAPGVTLLFCNPPSRNEAIVPLRLALCRKTKAPQGIELSPGISCWETLLGVSQSRNLFGLRSPHKDQAETVLGGTTLSLDCSAL